jgi:hypothetical protein
VYTRLGSFLPPAPIPSLTTHSGLGNCLKVNLLSWVWWNMPAISALRRLRHEDHKFKANLDYIKRPRLKKYTYIYVHTIYMFNSMNNKCFFFLISFK